MNYLHSTRTVMDVRTMHKPDQPHMHLVAVHSHAWSVQTACYMARDDAAKIVKTVPK